MYDVDNLSSPPSSVGSDTNLTSYDPLLDFTKQDGLDHQPGVKSAGAEMNESVENMQRQMKVKCFRRLNSQNVRITATFNLYFISLVQAKR